jgi:hypothetical protein
MQPIKEIVATNRKLDLRILIVKPLPTVQLQNSRTTSDETADFGGWLGKKARPGGVYFRCT